MGGMYKLNGGHGPEPRSSGGKTSSNPQVSALFPRPAFNDDVVWKIVDNTYMLWYFWFVRNFIIIVFNSFMLSDVYIYIYICVGNLSIIVSDNGLSLGRRHGIIWTSAGILLLGNLGTISNKILIEIHTFWFKKMNWKMWSQNSGHFVLASMC